MNDIFLFNGNLTLCNYADHNTRFLNLQTDFRTIVAIVIVL